MNASLERQLLSATVDTGGGARRPLTADERRVAAEALAPYLAAFGIGAAERPLGVGDEVRWRSSNADKIGTIVGIVPAGTKPEDAGFTLANAGLARSHASYVVRGARVDRKGDAIGRPALFWPLVSLLTRVEKPMDLPTPRVAVATVVFDEKGRVLVIERMPGSATGGGDLAIPGGKLDAGESLVDGARRELFEEVGVEALSIAPLGIVTEDRLWGPLHHYVTHYYVVTSWIGTARVREPTKHARIDWIEPDRLRAAMEPPFDTGLRIFDPLGHLILAGGIEAAERIMES